MRFAGPLLAFAGLLSLTMSAPAAVGQSAEKPDAVSGRTCTFYEHADFGGEWREVGEHDEVPWIGSEWNDRISSMECHERCTATIYEHIDSGGESDRWNGRARTMGLRWNDRISSVRVSCTGNDSGITSTFGTGEESRRSCSFYADRNFEGASAVLAEGEDGSWVGDRWNDRISSIRCRAGCAAEVFRDIHYDGGSRFFTETAELDFWMDNAISSARVTCHDG